MRVLVIFAMVLSVSSLAAASWVYVSMTTEVKNLEERLRFEQSREEAEKKVSPVETAPDRFPLLEARLSTLEEKIESLQKPVGGDAGTLSASAPTSPGLPLPSSASPGAYEAGAEVPGEGASSPEEREDLKKKMKDLESKLDEVQKQLEEGKEEKKPKFDRFAARLGLDESQKAATREILLRGKGELLEHLLKPLPDGTVLADEFAEAFYNMAVEPEKAQAKAGQVFMRLFKEKVPGTEKTYVEVIGEMNERMAGEMKTVMTDEQREKYEKWAPDATDIEVPDGPIIKHIMEYMERRRAESGEEGWEDDWR